MKKLIAIGDCHGKYKEYRRIIREFPGSICVGDMGVGFRNPRTDDWMANPPYDEMVKYDAMFIRGNHDNPDVCRAHKRCFADGSVLLSENGQRIMFVGGAYSIDRDFRIEDYTWWRDEELSQPDMIKVHGIYMEIKPDVMVTHDCPIEVVKALHSHHMFDNSRTQQLFQAMWNDHKPKLWVFGHHHKSFDQVIEGTRFVCLNELEVGEFEV